MSQRTWLDVGSGWLTSFPPEQDDLAEPFTPQQAACLKLMLEEFGKKHGPVISYKVG